MKSDQGKYYRGWKYAEKGEYYMTCLNHLF